MPIFFDEGMDFIILALKYKLYDFGEIMVLPFVTNFRVFPLCTLSVFRFTASTEMARHACVSTPSTSICDCRRYFYKYNRYFKKIRNKTSNKEIIVNNNEYTKQQ